MKESWWIDLLEGEMVAIQNHGMKLLALYSSTDKLIIRNLRRIKMMIKTHLTVEVPQNDEYYRDLHARIMNQVTFANFEKKDEVKKRRAKRMIRTHKLQVAKHFFSMGL